MKCTAALYVVAKILKIIIAYLNASLLAFHAPSIKLFYPIGHMAHFTAAYMPLFHASTASISHYIVSNRSRPKARFALIYRSESWI